MLYQLLSLTILAILMNVKAIRWQTAVQLVLPGELVKPGKEPGSIRFLFDGDRIAPESTPMDWGMEDEDEIDAMVESHCGQQQQISHANYGHENNSMPAETVSIMPKDIQSIQLAEGVTVMPKDIQSIDTYIYNVSRKIVSIMPEDIRSVQLTDGTSIMPKVSIVEAGVMPNDIRSVQLADGISIMPKDIQSIALAEGVSVMSKNVQTAKIIRAGRKNATALDVASEENTYTTGCCYDLSGGTSTYQTLYGFGG